jgi:OOP family OmpA-OmpF porin
MKKIALALLLSGAVAAPAAAADLYFGVKAGSANKKVPTISESSSAFGIFGGYAVNPNFAVEIGYANLGKVQEGVEFSTLEADAVGILPINDQLSVYGKLGFANTKEKTSTRSGSRSAATYGFGGIFNVTSNVGVRLSWDRYGFGDSGGFTKGDCDFVAIGAVFKY